MLKTFRDGQLVTVASESGAQPGVVAHIASLVKVEVAVEEAASGPMIRTVHPRSLTPREEPGPADDALRRLIHRGGAVGHQALGGASGRDRRAHTRAAAHRPPGR